MAPRTKATMMAVFPPLRKVSVEDVSVILSAVLAAYH